MNDLEQCSVFCRRQQGELLATLLDSADGWALPSLFVYGHTATGKTTTINFVLQKHVRININCVECFTARLMFEAILSRLQRFGILDGPPVNGITAVHCRCDNMNDFVRQLRQIVSEKHLDGRCIYIVMERAERLREADANLLAAFIRLQELSGLNIGIIMESEIVWDKFRYAGLLEPYVIHFPNYTKDELLEIISHDAPSSCSSEAYRGYTNLLLSVFYVVCHNLSELRHLAAVNFAKYMEPVMNGEATVDDTHKLWRNIEPHLRRSLQTVYLREVSGAQWERMQQAGTETTQTNTSLSSRMHLELPVYSKYLVIAAYIASYNPAKSDKRFFLKKAGKINKRAQAAKQKKNERLNNHLLGPKLFPIDRLMAIFYTIVGVHVPPSANIFSQLSSLVTLGLLTQVSSADPLEAPKYKCVVSLEFVKSISRSVNFEVLHYLYDFVGP
jgi:origin recognition complex subunit 5